MLKRSCVRQILPRVTTVCRRQITTSLPNQGFWMEIENELLRDRNYDGLKLRRRKGNGKIWKVCARGFW